MGALKYIRGAYRKIGLHGKVFTLVDGEWILSTITSDEFNRKSYGYKTERENVRSPRAALVGRKNHINGKNVKYITVTEDIDKVTCDLIKSRASVKKLRSGKVKLSDDEHSKVKYLLGLGMPISQLHSLTNINKNTLQRINCYEYLR